MMATAWTLVKEGSQCRRIAAHFSSQNTKQLNPIDRATFSLGRLSILIVRP